MVTHIGEDAEVASEVGFIDGGRIILEDSPERLKERSGLQNDIEVEVPFKNGEVESVLRAFSVDGGLQETEEGYRVFCEDPEEAMPNLMRALDDIGSRAMRVETGGASLEDVFFKATSKTLRGRAR